MVLTVIHSYILITKTTHIKKVSSSAQRSSVFGVPNLFIDLDIRMGIRHKTKKLLRGEVIIFDNVSVSNVEQYLRRYNTQFNDNVRLFLVAFYYIDWPL